MFDSNNQPADGEKIKASYHLKPTHADLVLAAIVGYWQYLEVAVTLPLLRDVAASGRSSF